MANIIKRVWNQNRMVQIEDLRGMTFQAEAAGHTFQISGIDDEGNTVALTGTPSGVLLRPDNTDVALTCSVSGGVVSATLPANCYDVPGRFGLTIFITSGSSKTAIYAAVGTVTRTSSGTVAPGTSQSVVDLINAINAAVNSIPASYSALLADIAPTYSNSALYSVGQYAWYDGDLKRCIVPITTAESYTAAHWTSAVLGQDVSDLKSAIDACKDDLRDMIGLFEFSWEHGGMYSATGIEYSSGDNVRTTFKAVSGAGSIIVSYKNTSGTNAALYEFASDTTTTSGTNERLAITYIAPNTSKTITLNANTKYIRLMVPSGNVSDGDYCLVYTFGNIISTDYNTKFAWVDTKITDLEKSNVYRNFVLADDTVSSSNATTFINRLSAIHSIKLIGFEGYEKCRLRYICRNHSTMKYRFVICGYDGATWRDVFDTLSTFTVTENANGDTIVVHSIGSMTVIMSIDYSSMMTDGTAWLIDMPTDPYRFIISPNAYYAQDIHYEESGNNNELYVQLLNDNLSIIFKYSDTELMKIEFYPYGVNGLFSPHKISKKISAVLTPDFSGFTTAWQTINTDIVSPYAGLIDTAYARTSVITVGGNHGTDGASGFPTATRVSYDVYVDGVKLNDKDSVSGNRVCIVVKSNVAASNTIDTETGDFTPVMQETATWIATPQNIEVNVQMKALTNISILGYVGLQAVCESYSGVYFNDGTAEKTIADVRIDSAVYPGFNGERAIMTASNGDVYVLYTNRSVGVGDLSHLSNNTPVSFVSAYDKLYQHLVKSNPINLDENEIAVYSGGFTIMPSYDCTGAKSAYFIKLNGERIYCVDFLASGSCYVDLPTECVGKQITIVEKSDSITEGQIVTGEGLFVSATGHGTLKFRIA